MLHPFLVPIQSTYPQQLGIMLVHLMMPHRKIYRHTYRLQNSCSAPCRPVSCPGTSAVLTQNLPPTHLHAYTGTTLNSALGVGAPNTYKDFGSMYKNETKERIRAWEILVGADCWHEEAGAQLDRLLSLSGCMPHHEHELQKVR